MAVVAETDFDGFREVGALSGGPANDPSDETLPVADGLAAEWRGRWDEF